MKNKLLASVLLLLGLSATSFAQTFEGIIKWKMQADMEINKPKKEISKEDASKAAEGMNEGQKALMEKMNDPEFKKQMEANPQMKAQMEQMLAKMSANKQMTQGMADAGGDISKMMPTGMLMKFKNGNRVVKMEGGMAAMIGEILYLKDKGQSYRLNRDKKSYSPLPASNEKEINSKAKVTKTDEFITILGYKCRKYISETNDNNKKVTTYFWTTTEMKELDYSMFEKMSSGKNNMSLPAGVEGIPLKFEAITEGGKMAYEVTEIKKQALDNSDFIIPSDFKETQGFGAH